MNSKIIVSNFSHFRLPLALRLLVPGLFLFGPLVSCSSDTDKPEIVRSAYVPDDGYKPPQKAKKSDKKKPKIVSYRKHEPVDI